VLIRLNIAFVSLTQQNFEVVTVPLFHGFWCECFFCGVLLFHGF